MTTTDAPDPLTAGCPDCAAPAGQPCRMSDTTDQEVHADRYTAAAATEAGAATGVCGLCGLPAAPPLGCTAHGYADVQPPTGPLCPECRTGKPGNCTGLTLDPVTDDFVPCATTTGSPT